MQAALCFTAPLPLTPTKTLPSWRQSPKQHRTLVLSPIKAAIATTTPEISTVDYSSKTSVFPAEAYDTIGGDACVAEMYPEVKPPANAVSTKARAVNDEVDREYMEYSEPKTVFPAEACDDLGGEFCEPEYQKGVYQ